MIKWQLQENTHTHTQTGCNDNTEHEAAIIIYVWNLQFPDNVIY